MRARLLDVGLRDDLSGEVEPFAEVIEALRGEGVVVPLPGELGLEVAFGGKGLAGLDHLSGLSVPLYRNDWLVVSERLRRGSSCRWCRALAG